MDINIEEQEAKLRAEAQRIGEELAQVRQGKLMLEQKEHALVHEALKNQGALDLLKGLAEKPNCNQCRSTTEDDLCDKGHPERQPGNADFAPECVDFEKVRE